MSNYNLLPHQEELVRELVRVYREGYSQTFIVHRRFGGCYLDWDGNPDINFEEETLWENLDQISNEGLLGWEVISEHRRSYRITQATLNAVDSDFGRSDSADESAPLPGPITHIHGDLVHGDKTTVGNVTGSSSMAIGRGAGAQLDQSRKSSEGDSQAGVKAARVNNRGIIIAAIITAISVIVVALIGRDFFNLPKGQVAATSIAGATEEPIVELNENPTATTDTISQETSTPSVTPIPPTTTPEPIKVISSFSSDEWYLEPFEFTGERSIEDGALKITIFSYQGPDSWIWTWAKTESFSDFIVSVEAQTPLACSGVYGFVFHMTDADNAYQAVVNTEGESGFRFKLEGKIEPTDLEIPQTSFDTHALHYLRLEVAGQEMKFFVDDNPVIYHYDNPVRIRQGEFGLIAESQDETCDFIVKYHNISLQIFK